MNILPTSRVRSLASVLVLGALACAVLPAHAEGDGDFKLEAMMKMQHVDKNRDGRVSRQEFLDRMGAVWDMRMRKAGMKDGPMTPDEFEKMILLYLRAGG